MTSGRAEGVMTPRTCRNFKVEVVGSQEKKKLKIPLIRK